MCVNWHFTVTLTRGRGCRPTHSHSFYNQAFYLRATLRAWMGAEIQHSCSHPTQSGRFFQLCEVAIASPGMLPDIPALHNCLSLLDATLCLVCPWVPSAPQCPFLSPGLPHVDLRLCRAIMVLFALLQTHTQLLEANIRRWILVLTFREGNAHKS